MKQFKFLFLVLSLCLAEAVGMNVKANTAQTQVQLPANTLYRAAAQVAADVEPQWTSTLMVSTLAELKSAIANAGATPTLITLTADITLGGTQLTIPATAVIKLTGLNGATTYKIDANNKSRVLFVTAGATLYLQDITITGGYVYYNYSDAGAGIYCAGTLNLKSGCIITGNTSYYNGGGIYISEGGSFTAADSEISHNTTWDANGAGMYFESKVTATLTNCKITNNVAGEKYYSGDGGGIYCSSYCQLYITDCDISYNTAYHSGGGIDAGGSTVVSVQGNSALTHNKLITRNLPSSSGVSNGAAIYCTRDYLDVGANVIFSDNHARSGYIIADKDLATYNAHILATVFTFPFANGYNNHDIYYSPDNSQLYKGVDLKGLPLSVPVGTQTLNYEIAPGHLQPLQGKWEVKDAGTTGAVVDNNGKLTVTSPGVARLLMTIYNCMPDSSDYTKDIYIAVTNSDMADHIYYNGEINPQVPVVYGSGLPTSYTYVDCMTFDPDGNLYITDHYSGIYKVQAGGGNAEIWLDGIGSKAIGIWYYKGDLYASVVYAKNSCGIIKISIATKQYVELAKISDDLGNIAIDTEGNLWVAGLNKVYKLTPDGMSVTQTIDVPCDVGAIVFDLYGNLYVSAGNAGPKIYKVNATAGTYEDTGIIGLNNSSELRFDSRGNLYIAEWGSNLILKVTPGSTIPTVICNTNLIYNFTEPAGLIMDSNENLYLCGWSSSVYKFSVSGGDLLSIYKTPTTLSPVQGTAGANAFVKVTAGTKTVVVQAAASGIWDATSAIGALSANEIVTAQVVSDAAGTKVLSDKVQAIVAVTTGIDVVETEHAPSLQAYVQNGELHVGGLTAGERWSVYNIAGGLIYQGHATGDVVTLSATSLPNHGLYIVQSGNKAVKVAY